MGVLEVSRSIGDGSYKNHGVTCIPDVKRCQITQDDRYIQLNDLYSDIFPCKNILFGIKLS